MSAFFEAQKQLNQEQYQKDMNIRKHLKNMQRYKNFTCALLAAGMFFFCFYLYSNIELLPATNEQEAIVNALVPFMFLFAGIWVYKDYAKKITQSFERKHQEFIDKTMMS